MSFGVIYKYVQGIKLQCLVYGVENKGKSFSMIKTEIVM